jgi:hypothetical protein
MSFSERFHPGVPAIAALIISDFHLADLRPRRIDAREVHPLATNAKRAVEDIGIRLYG